MLGWSGRPGGTRRATGDVVNCPTGGGARKDDKKERGSVGMGEEKKKDAVRTEWRGRKPVKST